MPAPTITWDQVTPAPVVLVSGPEGLLGERAVDRVIALAREADPEVEVTRLEAAGYESGQLAVATSPSLFGEARVVVLAGLESGTDAAFADVRAYLEAPEADAVLLLVHAGGNRGKPVLDAVRAAGATQVVCAPVKRDADKVAFVSAELSRGRRRAEPAAVHALVEACGADLRELAAACQQLLADTTGLISADVVGRYYGGRVEATGFRVADAAVEGNAGEAVAMLRHALATGTDPVPLVAALAARLRTLAKVAAARGRGLTAQDLGMAPWQLDRARRELVGWRPETLAAAITAVAQADAEVKGAGRDPVFAVERAVLRVSQAAQG
ncbi:DNA polymerase III subunit delta [Actinotalea sp. M2MS4P-6]|uniref:DNA polymerase III subunit delta n=1 Tax=Actinotalea sp. M2MS4P-6 TaxID=2983762 RepID=UPI0021E460F8|nr:DNA polymerase III subunit delta [Actinotalea sp. M2MS4P-6]MCV2393948.1 DNA polymerase III subunit delta [Actinotalea sp. M2MS4P-6]